MTTYETHELRTTLERSLCDDGVKLTVVLWKDNIVSFPSLYCFLQPFTCDMCLMNVSGMCDSSL